MKLPGASLWSMIEMLRQMQHLFPQVDIKYDPDASSTTPIILHLRPHLDLLFSGKHQRLRTICVRKLRETNPPVTLRYKDTVLSSTDEVLRRVGVSRTFGPTYAGDDLRYPGVCSALKRMFLFRKKEAEEQGDVLGEVAECPVMNGDISLAVVKVHDGVTLHFHPSTSMPVHVRIGTTTAQDLTIALGHPLRTYDDSIQDVDYTSSSYFYNYFQHGIDFYISGKTHIVKKIILQSNVPGSPLFQMYKRCNWEIEGKPEDDEDGQHTSEKAIFMIGSRPSVTFLVRESLHHPCYFDRTDDEDNITLPSATTRLHGYDGIILEVSEASQVVSVTLF
ncbi:hypothetical protein BDP27DRAFT_1413894 [Rhodocollybia butyracea]|uniref:Uncharacterized protein n=1 Tax=Rhodocollybia butyracea TaxID=206335 RepID=A0A9P5UEZ6_9AGAR|nr:hypothetical protein BDP27DRAFT_1413894 [Rhodocollybia butyracea]